jgi:hypothetical protein
MHTFCFCLRNQAQIKGQIWAIYSKFGEGEFLWVKKYIDFGFYLIHGETVFSGISCYFGKAKLFVEVKVISTE